VPDDDAEAALRELWRSGARAELVTRVMRAYGPEVFSYLLGALRGEGEASEAFSQFALNLWQASESFRGEASFRTWAYSLARHAVGRVVRERGKRSRHVELPSAIEGVAARVRTETQEHLRTEAKDRLARLREELGPDEQMILTLRVDRGFAWPDIARVLSDGEEVDERSIAALRKRFERLKERLRRRAKEIGLG
jgi:RNA polymerase sigma-70 factor (ECF subfamily)